MMRPCHFIFISGASAALLFPVLASAQTVIDYRCRDGSNFVISFYPPNYAAHVELDGKSMTLPKRRSWYGARYVKGDVTIRMMKSGALTLRRASRASTKCNVK